MGIENVEKAYKRRRRELGKLSRKQEQEAGSKKQEVGNRMLIINLAINRFRNEENGLDSCRSHYFFGALGAHRADPDSDDTSCLNELFAHHMLCHRTSSLSPWCIYIHYIYKYIQHPSIKSDCNSYLWLAFCLSLFFSFSIFLSYYLSVLLSFCLRFSTFLPFRLSVFLAF